MGGGVEEEEGEELVMRRRRGYPEVQLFVCLIPKSTCQPYKNQQFSV